MQYKYYNDGSYDELSVKVIDVGIGLERIPWLINGTATSYFETFSHSFKFLQSKLEIPLDNETWEHMGPYSCKLDIDEAEDIEKSWQEIADKVGLPV